MKLTQAEYLPWFQKIVQKILKFLDEMQKKQETDLDVTRCSINLRCVIQTKNREHSRLDSSGEDDALDA